MKWFQSTCILALACFCVAPVRAEKDDRLAYADSLFQEGVRAMKADDCTTAIPKFLSSYRLDPAASSLVNLATCYGKLGRTASAWRSYRSAAELAAREGDEELKEQALRGAALLDPLVTKLKLVTLGRSNALNITLNGEPISLEKDAPIPLDPGESVIEAFGPEQERWRRTVTANEPGALIVIDVPELAPAPPEQHSNTRRTAALIVSGVGVAGILSGMILGVSARSAYNDSKTNCDANGCNALGHELRDRALERADGATIAVGLGSIAVATGAVLWLTAPQAKGAAIWLAPVVSAQTSTVGLSLRGKL